MSLVVLGANDVEGIISKMTVDDFSNLMASVFCRYSLKSHFAMPHRTVLESPTFNTLFMPSSLANSSLSIKTVSVPKPGMQGSTYASTLLIDEETGAAKALINAGCLTAYRTAAGSLLATSLLLLRQNALPPKVLVMFGAGAQIEAHIILFLQKFSSVSDCIIVNRSLNSRLNKMVQKVQERFPHVTFRTSGLEQDSLILEEIVRTANIICTATPSRTPLFPTEWVKNGTHVNLVGSYTPGMMEIETSLFSRCSKIVVDSRDACSIEAGEFIKAKLPRDRLVEIGELVDAEKRGDRALAEEVCAKDVTIFKSVGIGLQDTAIAQEVYDKAMEMNIGVRLDTFH